MTLYLMSTFDLLVEESSHFEVALKKMEERTVQQNCNYCGALSCIYSWAFEQVRSGHPYNYRD